MYGVTHAQNVCYEIYEVHDTRNVARVTKGNVIENHRRTSIITVRTLWYGRGGSRKHLEIGKV